MNISTTANGNRPAGLHSDYPVLIQGGMGVGVSNWTLARAVARAGERYRASAPVLGVVSGTGAHNLMVNRLQDGDPGGHMQLALAAFPLPQIAEPLLEKYYRNVQRPSGGRYRLPPKLTDLGNTHGKARGELISLIVCANFVEVWLAKQGHQQPIGVNYLEKIQLPRVFELYGAMLAGVDYVLMGAGIPSQVPGVLDKLADYLPVTYKLDVSGGAQRHEISFDPTTLMPPGQGGALKRPRFLAIITSDILAKVLATKASGFVDGFIIEGPVAGGHNAPPRGQPKFNDLGEPIYGERDTADLDQLRQLGRPFWLAGAYASPEKLQEARRQGASGIQAGTIFAYSEESGLQEEIKSELRKRAFRDELAVLADPKASPSGFPFQVAQLDGTLSDTQVYDERRRICTIGYLVQAYQTRTGGLGFRCPAEPVSAYLQKGGSAEAAVGRKCICNGLMAAVGLGLDSKLGVEPPIVTSGRDYSFIKKLISYEEGRYTAEDVVRFLLPPSDAGPLLKTTLGIPRKGASLIPGS